MNPDLWICWKMTGGRYQDEIPVGRGGNRPNAMKIIRLDFQILTRRRLHLDPVKVWLTAPFGPTGPR